jgi:hypothetical protein
VTAYETYTLNAAGPTSTDFKNQLMSLGGQDPESSKKNDRENVRRFDELKYNLKKEIGKILLKSKEAAESLPGGNNAVALIPVVEGLTNTTCPSIVKDVSESLKEAFQEQQDFVLRNDDLVQQAMKRLPVEATGTTVPVSAEKWADIADDIQASLIVVSRVVETNPPNDSNDHPTWDYLVGFEAYQMDPKKRTYTRIYQRQVPYSAFKPDALVRPRADYQALYLPTHSAEIPLLASLIHFYDLNTTFLGGHLWENKSVLDDAAKDVEGAYFVTGFFRDSEQGTTKKFVQDYVAKFNQVPDLLAAQGYDAANLLLKAIATSMSREDIHNKLLEIKDFDGVCGKTTFGGHGEANKIVPVLKIEGGKYKQVQ